MEWSTRFTQVANLDLSWWPVLVLHFLNTCFQIELYARNDVVHWIMSTHLCIYVHGRNYSELYLGDERWWFSMKIPRSWSSKRLIIIMAHYIHLRSSATIYYATIETEPHNHPEITLYIIGCDVARHLSQLKSLHSVLIRHFCTRFSGVTFTKSLLVKLFPDVDIITVCIWWQRWERRYGFSRH